MLEVLSNFDPPPESVPINCLMGMPGTPLADQPPVDIFELVRLIAVTRSALPKGARPPGRGAHEAVARRSGTLLFCGCKFDFLR
jgi:biotin synthase